MRAIQIDPKDNVAVVIQPTESNSILRLNNGGTVVAKEFIPAGHKIAITDLKENEEIYKFGQVIGLAAEDISCGEYIHCHNIIDITEKLCDAFVSDYMKEK